MQLQACQQGPTAMMLLEPSSNKCAACRAHPECLCAALLKPFKVNGTKVDLCNVVTVGDTLAKLHSKCARVVSFASIRCKVSTTHPKHTPVCVFSQGLVI